MVFEYESIASRAPLNVPNQFTLLYYVHISLSINSRINAINANKHRVVCGGVNDPAAIRVCSSSLSHHSYFQHRHQRVR